MSATATKQTLPGMGTANAGITVPARHDTLQVAVPALTSCTLNAQLSYDGGTNWYGLVTGATGDAFPKTSCTGGAVYTLPVTPGCKFRLTTNIAGNDAIQPVLYTYKT